MYLSESTFVAIEYAMIFVPLGFGAWICHEAEKAKRRKYEEERRNRK